MLELSNILFPKIDICEEKEMYFRSYNVHIGEKEIFFSLNGVVRTSTYFNSFSLEKWKKYTIIDNLKLLLKLKGSFNVKLFSMNLKNDKIDNKEIFSTIINSHEVDSFIFNFDMSKGEIVYFELTALQENSIFEGGFYYSDLKNKEICSFNLAIGICTFQREQFIIANLERLTSEINNEKSILYNKLDVFVSDNGQTLPIEDLNNNNIHIFKNKNLGGAGGFGRCMIEAINKNETEGKKYRYFIFMDDDIILDINAIIKNYIFAMLLKKQFQNNIIGGAMFSTDERFLQFENGALWENINFNFNRRNTDMRLENNIILNERTCRLNYNAWCYCCYPFSFITKSNLPLPLFFHMDDVEFSLRNNVNVITLNGINVWHLYKKALINPKNDYYDVRNKLIMLSEIDPKNTGLIVNTYLSAFVLDVLKYHYARAINAFNGIIDFCKGFDYFKNSDTIECHKKLFSNVKWEKASKEDKYLAEFSNKDERGRKFKLQNALLQLLPSRKTKKVIYDNNSVKDVKGLRSITVYNAADDVSLVYKKNLALAIKCLIKRIKIKYLLKHKLDIVIREFNCRISELQHYNFWDNYLSLNNLKTPKYKILFAASDNDMTSGAFRSMVFLNKILQENYNVDTMVMLPQHGDGIILLKQNDIRFTIFESEDWVVKKDSSQILIDEKISLINNKNKVSLDNISAFISKEKFDLIHINTSYHYVSALAGIELNIPIVWHLREFLEEDQQRHIIDRAKGYSLMSKSNKIIAISNSIYNKYDKIFPKDKLKIIYNGIDATKYYNKYKNIFEKEKLIFVCVGFIVNHKGQHLLIEACGKLKENGFDNFEILFIGKSSDEYMLILNELIVKYKLINNVKFMGKQNDVSKFYKDSDIAFVCSNSEAFGRVTVEAMMSGCLVIGANNAGTAELIEHNKEGLLFEPLNSDDLYNKIMKALNNREKMQKIAAQGRKRALDFYTAEINAKNIYDLYEEILEK